MSLTTGVFIAEISRELFLEGSLVVVLGTDNIVEIILDSSERGN